MTLDIAINNIEDINKALPLAGTIISKIASDNKYKQENKKLDDIMMNEKYIFLLGATGGIGELLAEELSKKGYKIIGIARSEEKLKKMKDNNILFDYISADITKNDDIKKIANKIIEYSKKYGKENVYVFYNQGILYNKSGLDEYSDQDIENSFEVNIMSIMKLDKEIYKSVGGLIYMVSISAYQRGEWDISYQVTKAALKAYLESLSLRIEKLNNESGKSIKEKIFAIFPDTVKTGEKGMGAKLQQYPKIPSDIFIKDVVKEIEEFIENKGKYTINNYVYVEIIYSIDYNTLDINKYILTDKDRDEDGRIPYSRRSFAGILGKAVY